MLKAIGLKEIEQIFAVIEPLGISREAVVIRLQREHPGRVARGAGGKLEIVVERDADFSEWIKGLADRVRAAMNQKPL
ncbi:MAG: hypothetical protein WA005_01055 [Candidatus Binataceae bacterium]